MKKCRVCKAKFEPFNSLQQVCSTACALQKAQKDLQKDAERKAKEQRKWVREQKAKLKTRGEHLKEAQQAFNAYIRERDRHRPCISCGTYTAGQYHAGHYRTTKAAPELRFEELNCHKQCAQCNNFDSGNIVEYRISLIQRIGQEAVDWLEGPHEAKHYTTDELKEIKRKYRSMKRELERAAA
ncbi:recombination protein NinG [Marinobacter nauticus]|uniref:recombination protein NinG n=1 Tax=Marinobacter nauticus TaxID=2743 RepID=UPI002E282E4F|nr:recombination protein NinG [Marinobacter nauticus]